MRNTVTHGWRLGVAVVGAASAMVGCGGGSDPALSPSPTNMSAPSQVPGASGPDDRAAVEAVYTDFWVRTFHTGVMPEDRWHGAMSAVAVDPQLTTTLNAMHAQKEAGLAVYGDVTARIVSVRIGDTSATVVDCQDASRSGQADARTGDRKTVGILRNPVTANLTRDKTDGRWKVNQVTFPGGVC